MFDILGRDILAMLPIETECVYDDWAVGKMHEHLVIAFADDDCVSIQKVKRTHVIPYEPSYHGTNFGFHPYTNQVLIKDEDFIDAFSCDYCGELDDGSGYAYYDLIKEEM